MDGARIPNKNTQILLNTLRKSEEQGNSRKMNINPFISELARLYEKVRNAMDYREEGSIRRAAIERILRRRLRLTKSGQKVGEPLLRELVWAHYFPIEEAREDVILKISELIDFYLKLREELSKTRRVHKEVETWIYQFMSSDIDSLLSRGREKETLCNFIFHILKKSIIISDDSEQTRDIQVYIAIRKSFANEDLAFLRFHLFRQFFGSVNTGNLPKIVADFENAYKTINYQLNYPLKDRIFAFIKRQIPPFLILNDLLKIKEAGFENLITDKTEFKNAVENLCLARYQSIKSRVRRVIIRSIIFILFTKFIFAASIESLYENFMYGRVLWNSIAINVAIPPLLMFVTGLFIKLPDKKNTAIIYERLDQILFEENTEFNQPLYLQLKTKSSNSFLFISFIILWLLAFIVSFGLIILILSKLHFNIVSQVIFVFFLAIVSFFAYKTSQIAHIYTVKKKEGFLSPFIDFFFMPIVRVGRELTEGISQINIFLFFFDFFIEAPFKGISSFLEQWFFFLQAKREELE